MYFGTIGTRVEVADVTPGGEVLEVTMWIPGYKDPKRTFMVMRPWGGAFGPYRYRAVARDVLYDLWRAKVDPGYISFLEGKREELPEVGISRGAYDRYVREIDKVSRGRLLSEERLENAVEDAAWKVDNLKEEDRDPETSTHNAYVLFNRWGLPDRLTLCHHGRKVQPSSEVMIAPNGFSTMIEWDAYGKHELKGYVWGTISHPGTALINLFREIGMMPKMRTFEVTHIPGKWPTVVDDRPWRRGRKAWDPVGPEESSSENPVCTTFDKGLHYGLED